MTEDNQLKTKIREEVLLNAILFDGKANPKAVMGKILGKYSEYRKEVKLVSELIQTVIEEYKGYSVDDIKQELTKINPDAISTHKKKKEKSADIRREQKKELEELDNVVKGKFKVRYAPDPSKYPHIGQGMNYLINRMYADKYDGKVILRFDDTNPKIVRKEYYQAIKDGMTWLGATWDEEVRASELIEEFYDLARTWIDKNYLYVCTCEPKKLSEDRQNKIPCKHRDQDAKQNSKLFEKMINGDYKVGGAIVRLLADMQSENNVMRDPIMFRLVEDQHPMLDKFYHVFPTYDFESPYLDNKYGVTHIIRSGEFGTMRQEMQSFIIEKLGGKIPEFKTFGRYNIQGCPTKGRVIRELVDNNIVTGWDDIRLITLVGLKKRGIHPRTPRILIEEAGTTPKNTNIAWTTFEKKSRELLEPTAKRLFYVENPVKLLVKDHGIEVVSLDFHPDRPEYGKRSIKLSDEFFVEIKDTAALKVGDVFRLKDLFNVKVLEIDADFIGGEFAGEEIIAGTRKIHWVSDDNIPGKLLVPGILEKAKGKINEDSLSEIHGLFEKSILKISSDEVVQLERVGYAKLKATDEIVTGHIVHKLKS